MCPPGSFAGATKDVMKTIPTCQPSEIKLRDRNVPVAYREVPLLGIQVSRGSWWLRQFLESECET